MRKSIFIIFFILTATNLFACECRRGSIGKHFLNNIKSFDVIVLVEASSVHDLVVKKVYKGKVKESDTLDLGGGFCSDFIIATNKGDQFILGVFESGSANNSFELTRCLSSKVIVDGKRTFIEKGRSEWGQPRIGLTKRKMKLKRLESRIKSKLWWSNLF